LVVRTAEEVKTTTTEAARPRATVPSETVPSAAPGDHVQGWCDGGEEPAA
jgi:hypothetical protein